MTTRSSIDEDASVQIFPPDAEAGDLGPMYVLDALGVSLLVRQRADGVYVHIDRDAESAPPAGTDDLPLIVEVNNGGENVYGEEPEGD